MLLSETDSKCERYLPETLSPIPWPENDRTSEHEIKQHVSHCESMPVNYTECVSEPIEGDDLYFENTEAEYSADNPYGVMEDAASDTNMLPYYNDEDMMCNFDEDEFDAHDFCACETRVANTHNPAKTSVTAFAKRSDSADFDAYVDNSRRGGDVYREAVDPCEYPSNNFQVSPTMSDSRMVKQYDALASQYASNIRDSYHTARDYEEIFGQRQDGHTGSMFGGDNAGYSGGNLQYDTGEEGVSSSKYGSLHMQGHFPDTLSPSVNQARSRHDQYLNPGVGCERHTVQRACGAAGDERIMNEQTFSSTVTHEGKWSNSLTGPSALSTAKIASRNAAVAQFCSFTGQDEATAHMQLQKTHYSVDRALEFYYA